MKRISAIGISLVISLVLPAVFGLDRAVGQTAGQTPGPAREIAALKECIEKFKEMDKDQDGMVTESEFTAVPHKGGEAKALFKSMDVSGKGYLTRHEYCVESEKMREKPEKAPY
jgi:hypothetical protein